MVKEVRIDTILRVLKAMTMMEVAADVEFQDTIEPLDEIPEYGKPAVVFPDDAKPRNVVESIVDDQFFIMCIESTNEHGSNDPEFMQKIRVIGADERGINLI